MWSSPKRLWPFFSPLPSYTIYRLIGILKFYYTHYHDSIITQKNAISITSTNVIRTTVECLIKWSNWSLAVFQWYLPCIAPTNAVTAFELWTIYTHMKRNSHELKRIFVATSSTNLHLSICIKTPHKNTIKITIKPTYLLLVYIHKISSNLFLTALRAHHFLFRSIS